MSSVEVEVVPGEGELNTPEVTVEGQTELVPNVEADQEEVGLPEASLEEALEETPPNSEETEAPQSEETVTTESETTPEAVAKSNAGTAELDALFTAAESVFGDDAELVQRVQAQLKEQQASQNDITMGLSELGELLAHLKANPESIDDIENGIVSAKATVLEGLREGPPVATTGTYIELFQAYVAPVEPAPETTTSPETEQTPENPGTTRQNIRPGVEIPDSVKEISGITAPEVGADGNVYAFGVSDSVDAAAIIQFGVGADGQLVPQQTIPMTGELLNEIEQLDLEAIRRVAPGETVDVDGEPVVFETGGFIVVNEGNRTEEGLTPAQLILLESNGTVRDVIEVDKEVQDRIMDGAGLESLSRVTEQQSALYEKGARYLVATEEDGAIVALDGSGEAVVGPLEVEVPGQDREQGALSMRSLVSVPGTDRVLALYSGYFGENGNQVVLQELDIDADKGTVGQSEIIALSESKDPELDTTLSGATVNIGDNPELSRALDNMESMYLVQAEDGWDLVLVSDNNGNPDVQYQGTLVISLDQDFNFKGIVDEGEQVEAGSETVESENDSVVQPESEVVDENQAEVDPEVEVEIPYDTF